MDADAIESGQQRHATLRWSALSFDLDGTLVDSLGEITAAANQAIAEFGFAAQPPAAIAVLVGGGGRELVRRLLERLATLPPNAALPRRGDATAAAEGAEAAPPSLERLFGRFMHHYAALAGTMAKPYPGCDEALRQLLAAGVRLACVTNKDEREAQRVLQATRLDDCFELLLGGDSLAQKKPQREVLDHVLRTFGIERGAFAHVGDSAVDIAAARNAGVAAWAVPWGYNGGKPIAAAQPDRLFGSLAEIADFVCAENRACSTDVA